MKEAAISNDARLIAYYLPQFHPIPENDRWWGRGFTEWTNVAAAKPLFKGHYQPHLPTDLGFYDLRLPQVRYEQAALARRYGIHGFCYWHYWFHGHRLLEQPLQEVLALGEPDFPFCLAWANESWSRRWLGEPLDILIEQRYSPEDDLAHIRALLPVFQDGRYIRVKGRPLFLVYRPLDLPNPRQTTDLFRHECVKHGLPEPYLLGINARCATTDCRQLGFDGTTNHEPHLGVLRDWSDDRAGLRRLIHNARLGVFSPLLKVYDCQQARQLMAQWSRPYPTVPTVFVGWDNTPRRGRHAIVLINNTPESFKERVIKAVESVMNKPCEDRLVFLNAWNEWAEGMHLEPCTRWGHAWLQAILEATQGARLSRPS